MATEPSKREIQERMASIIASCGKITESYAVSEFGKGAIQETCVGLRDALAQFLTVVETTVSTRAFPNSGKVTHN